MLRENPSLMNQESQLLPPKNRLSKQRMVSQSRQPETRLRKLKNKSSKHLRFLKRNKNRINPFLLSMIKVS